MGGVWHSQRLMFDLIGAIKFEQFLRFLEAKPRESANDAETVAAPAESFYQHLCDSARARHCCYAPAHRYCPEGERLREAYYQAVQAAK
jgi:hypothetical protein